MKFSVVWTAFASFQLDLAYNFAVKQSVSYADKVVADILSRTRQLNTFPNSGALEEAYAHFAAEYRYLVSGHYKIIYRLEGQTVLIVHVFDTRQDPHKLP